MNNNKQEIESLGNMKDDFKQLKMIVEMLVNVVDTRLGARQIDFAGENMNKTSIPTRFDIRMEFSENSLENLEGVPILFEKSEGGSSEFPRPFRFVEVGYLEGRSRVGKIRYA